MSRGHTIAKWHEDLDESGAKAERPGFQDALARIERGETGGIAVAKLDRFSRSVRDAANALRRIDDAGGVFLSADDGLDTSTPIGRFALNMMFAIAELEWERRRENWATARRKAVERGVHIASRPPTGYDRDDAGRLVTNKYAPKVRKVFEARAAGASWSELAAVMEGVPSPFGSTTWANRSLWHLLRNRAYLGEARSGEFVNPDAHEAIIDEALFDKAQREPVAPSPRHGESLLAGIVRCAGCRYALKPDRMKPKYEDGERVRIYRCRGTRSVGKCPAPVAVMGRVIEPYVEQAFLEQFADVGGVGADRDADLDAAQAELAEAYEQRDAFLALTIDDPEAAQAELDRRQDRVRMAQARIDELAGPLAQQDFALDVEWPELPTSEKNALLRAGIDAVFVRRAPHRGTSPIEDRTAILWNGEGPDDLPGPGRRGLDLASYDW